MRGRSAIGWLELEKGDASRNSQDFGTHRHETIDDSERKDQRHRVDVETQEPSSDRNERERGQRRGKSEGDCEEERGTNGRDATES